MTALIKQVTLRTAGIGESHLQEMLAPVVGELPPTIRLAYLPSLWGVRLRLTETVDRKESGDGFFESLVERVRQAAGRHVVGAGDESLEEVVGKMLAERDLRIGLAESCTGGAVCDRLTDVPGASAYVAGGVIAYCNSVKIDVLGVDPDVLEREGAVSEAVARQMALGVLRLTGADIAASSTGILGPAGGTSEKPVGTVWIAWAARGETDAHLLRLGRDRRMNKERATAAVLDMIRLRLERWDEKALRVES